MTSGDAIVRHREVKGLVMPSEETREELRTAYEAVPEHHRERVR